NTISILGWILRLRSHIVARPLGDWTRRERQLQQQRVELFPLLVVQRGEQLVLRAARQLPTAAQRLPTLGRDMKRVRAPVARMPPALDETLRLQLVDRRNHRAGIDPDALAERVLSEL